MAERTESKWYDASGLEELHADLRQDFTRTLEVLSKRPVLRAHFDACSTCQQIREESIAKLPQPQEISGHRRELVRLDNAKLRFVLGLPADVEIVAATANMDPLYVDLLITGPDIAMVPLSHGATYSKLEY